MRLVLGIVFLSFFCTGCNDRASYGKLEGYTEENTVDVEQPSVAQDDTETISILETPKKPKKSNKVDKQNEVVIDDSNEIEEEKEMFADESKEAKEIYRSITVCDKDAFALVLEHVPTSGMYNRNSTTPLIRSIRHGCLDLMRLLIAHGVDINEVDGWGYTPLHWAATKNNSSALRELLALPEVKANVKDTGYGRTPLLWAMYTLSLPQNHIKLENLELLINSPKVDINKTDFVSNANAIIYAARLSHDRVMTLNRKKLVETLLESQEIDIFHEDKHGLDALRWAEQKYNVDVAKLLRDRMYQIRFGTN